MAYRYDPLVSKRLVLEKNISGVLWNVTVAYPINKIMNKIHIRHHIHICNSGEYVSLTLVNDNVKDCKSGDDETSFSCFIHGKTKKDSLCKTSCLTPYCTCDDLYYQSIGGGCLPYSSKCGSLYNINGLKHDTMFVELLEWFRMKQTKMYICTFEEFILVDIWIHCCTKLKLN